MIAEFKTKYNRDITVGTSPFHCIVSDQQLLNYSTAFKFNPPFRSDAQMQQLNGAISDGLIHHLTALHVPQTGDIYPHSFYDQPFGNATIESFLNVASHVLVEQAIKKDDFATFFSFHRPLICIKKHPPLGWINRLIFQLFNPRKMIQKNITYLVIIPFSRLVTWLLV